MNAALVALALAALAPVLGFGLWRAERKRETDLRAALAQLEERLARQGDELKAQRALAAGLGDHLQAMEKRLRKLEAQRLSLPPTGGKSYDEAVRMLRDGFGDREIIDLCGITEGELALIKDFYRAGVAD